MVFGSSEILRWCLLATFGSSFKFEFLYFYVGCLARTLLLTYVGAIIFLASAFFVLPPLSPIFNASVICFSAISYRDLWAELAASFSKVLPIFVFLVTCGGLVNMLILFLDSFMLDAPKMSVSYFCVFCF